jgi:predicted nucleotidyltransferase
MFSMNLKSFLVDIVNTKSLKIFKLFYSHDGEFSGREIAIHTKLNPIVCLKELEKLVSARMLDKKKVGASYLFSLNRNVYWDSVIDPLLKSEAKIFSHVKKDIVNVLGKYCSKIVVFGSYARGEQLADSDIDVCFIVKDKKKAQRILDGYKSVFFKKYQSHLSEYLITEIQYSSFSLGIVRDIRREGMIIYEKKRLL